MFSRRDRVGWLQVGAGLRCTADGDLQSWIGTQCIDVVAILIAGRHHQHPRPCHFGVAVTDTSRIAVIMERAGDGLGQTQTNLDLAKNDKTAIRRQAASIERDCE